MLVPIWTVKLDPNGRPISAEHVSRITQTPSMLNAPIEVDLETGVIEDGNHRVVARRKLGLLYVEVANRY